MHNYKTKSRKMNSINSYQPIGSQRQKLFTLAVQHFRCMKIAHNYNFFLLWKFSSAKTKIIYLEQQY